MARRKRNTRAKKQQEETLVDIVEARDQAQSFIDQNQNMLLGVLTGLVLLVGGWFAYKNFVQLPKQQEAVSQMFQAQMQFERDSFVQALTNPGGGYGGFINIIEDYGGTPAANLAKYYAGVSYLHLGEYDAAISYLEDYSPSGQVTPMTTFGVLGDAYAEKGDLSKALSLYKKAANAEDNDIMTPYYLKKVGMLNEKEGNMKDAAAAYQKIKEEYPNSVVGIDIDKYIERVGAGS